jgi:hypothetical protein
MKFELIQQTFLIVGDLHYWVVVDLKWFFFFFASVILIIYFIIIVVVGVFQFKLN